MLDFKSFTENLATLLNALTPKITIPFAVAAWVLLYIHGRALMRLPSSVVVAALITAVLCSCLAVTGSIAGFWKATAHARQLLLRQWFEHREKKRIERDMEFLNPKEREIIAYLLAHKLRVFEVLPDGEQAATLIAKGYVVWTSRKPPALHRDITVEIPLYIWEVLSKHQSNFPYHPLAKSENRPNPWRTPWIAR
jgi:hypothetical protein